MGIEFSKYVFAIFGQEIAFYILNVDINLSLGNLSFGFVHADKIPCMAAVGINCCHVFGRLAEA